MLRRTIGDLPWARAAGQLRRWILMLGFQALLLLGLLEAVGRLFDPSGISYYPQTAAYLDTLIFEEPIGYRHTPNFRGHFWGVPVLINSLGMRDRDVDVHPASDEFRILAMGDSFAFGLGVRYEDSIPQQLEGMLNAAPDRRKRFRVLNMGVPSYNTEQELIQLRTLGMTLRPNLVTLFFTSNDIYPKMWMFDKRRSPVVNVLQRSYAVTILMVLYRETRSALSPRRFDVGDYRVGNPRWRAIEESLAEIQALCRSAGIPFVLFTRIEPERGDILSLLSAVGQRSGFPVVNLLPQQDPRWAGQEWSRYVNSRVDEHPNPRGCRVYATLVWEDLRRRGLLPEQTEQGLP